MWTWTVVLSLSLSLAWNELKVAFGSLYCCCRRFHPPVHWIKCSNKTKTKLQLCTRRFEATLARQVSEVGKTHSQKSERILFAHIAKCLLFFSLVLGHFCGARRSRPEGDRERDKLCSPNLAESWWKTSHLQLWEKQKWGEQELRFAGTISTTCSGRKQKHKASLLVDIQKPASIVGVSCCSREHPREFIGFCSGVSYNLPVRPLTTPNELNQTKANSERLNLSSHAKFNLSQFEQAKASPNVQHWTTLRHWQVSNNSIESQLDTTLVSFSSPSSSTTVCS